jgi:hypothetical protein
MIRNALLVVMLTGCANIAWAQEFPVWESLLRHYSAKTDETPVPSMKMGRHMQMSLKGDPAPGDAARARTFSLPRTRCCPITAMSRQRCATAISPFIQPAELGEEIHYTNYRYRRKEQQHVDYTDRGRFSTSALRRD